jgi:hypothetical protein
MQALFKLLCVFPAGHTQEREEERQRPRITPLSQGHSCGRASPDFNGEGQSFTHSEPRDSHSALEASSTDVPCRADVSSDTADCSLTSALPATYHVWYVFHKLRYTIRIRRGRPLPPSSPSTISSQSSPRMKRHSTMEILGGPADLEDLDRMPEHADMDESVSSPRQSSSTITTAKRKSAAPICDAVQLKMRRSFRGGWRIRLTDAAGNDSHFRAYPDSGNIITTSKQRAHTWSEEATGRIMARSGRLAKGKPFMRFTCDEEQEEQEDPVEKQTQDDLVACWTAWLWADQAHTLNAGFSVESSKFVLVLFLTYRSLCGGVMKLLTPS